MSTPRLARDTESRRSATATTRGEETAPPEIETAELLDLLGDEYTREVLRTLAAEPRTGREIVAMADASKATVYRRLDRLSEAGLIESSTKLDPDGHHREQFRITFDGASCTVSEDGIEAELTVRDSDDDSRKEQSRAKSDHDRPHRRSETVLLQK
jgi:predicted transcriptional regulator